MKCPLDGEAYEAHQVHDESTKKPKILDGDNIDVFGDDLGFPAFLLISNDLASLNLCGD